MTHIRRFQDPDWQALWPMLRATIADGDTFAFAPESPEEEICRASIDAPFATFVACDEAGGVCGSDYSKPNQPGLGAHVCNCGYVVAPEARGRGIASAMCEHSRAQAVAMGFRAMQFNLVAPDEQTDRRPQ